MPLRYACSGEGRQTICSGKSHCGPIFPALPYLSYREQPRISGTKCKEVLGGFLALAPQEGGYV